MSPPTTQSSLPALPAPRRRARWWPRLRFTRAGPADAGTWIAASALVFVPAALADIVAAKQRPGPALLAWAATFALAMAAVHGAAWALAFGLVRRLPGFLRRIAWPAAGIGAGASLALELGAWARLGSKDHRLAILALVGSGAGGLLAGVLVALAQPRRGASRGLLVRRRRRPRGLVVLLLAFLGGACVYADRRYFVGGYPAAHRALELASLWLFACALVAVGVRVGARPRPARRRLYAALFAVAAAAPFVTLRERDQAEIYALLDRPFTRLLFAWARNVADIDRDGYASVLGGGDCAALDASISPAASEVPGNGIDDNCLLGDAPRVRGASAPPLLARPAGPSPRSVVLITVDTLRADHLSAYGYGRDTTPNLKRFATTSAQFDRAFTSGGWTSVAVSSLLRGLYPRHLLWTRLVETNRYRLLRFPADEQLEPGEKFRLGFALPLDDPAPTLPALLRRRGLHTVAVVDDGYSEFLSADFTSQGFDRFIEVNPTGSGGAKGDAATADMAIEVLRSMPAGTQFFLWVHFFGPHEPSTPHPGLPSYGLKEVDRYDQEIRFADQQVSRVIAATRFRSLDIPVGILVTSDHGEIIRNAHDRDHGSDLRPELLHVPLLLSASGVRFGRYTAPVSLVDIMPTILGLTETPAPLGLDGVDLRRVVAGDPAVSNRHLLVDTIRFNSRGNLLIDQACVTDGTYALVRDRTQNVLVLRALSGPWRRGNLMGRVPSAALEETLARYQEESGGALRLAPAP